MKMKNKLLISTIISIFFIGCNSNSSSTGSNDSNVNDDCDSCMDYCESHVMDSYGYTQEEATTWCSETPDDQYGCADSCSEPESQTIITSNIYEGNYYFDLLNGTETDSSSIWQISFQNKLISYECTQQDVETEALCSELGQTLEFYMPSIILGDVLASVYDIDYDGLDTYPDTFMNDASSFDNSLVEYGGENSIVMYDMSTHQISLSESVLIVYYMGNHTVYKIKFNEYSSGIISFDFQQL